jgi:hypothetical protein
MRASILRAGGGVALSALLLLTSSGGARAADAEPVTTVHPIFAAADVPLTDTAHQQFSAVVARRQLGQVEVMDIPGPPAPRAKALLDGGRAAVQAKKFPEAETALTAAANEVAVTGAAGLSSAELADLFLYLGMALQKADWKDPPTPYDEITPPAAKEAYLRAAVLAPERNLLPREFPPLAIISYKLAVAEVGKRGKGNLAVRAPTTALVSVDGGELKASGLPSLDLIQGDHWVRVEDPGRRPFGTVVNLNEPAKELEVPPQPMLALPDAPAAAHAKRQGAAYALVAELRPGRPPELELRLVHAQTGKRRDGTTVPAGDPTALEAAVARLEEIARKERFGEGKTTVVAAPALGEIALAPVAPEARDKRESPAAWFKARWPVLTAVGVAVGTALVLGVLVAHDDGK